MITSSRLLSVLALSVVCAVRASAQDYDLVIRRGQIVDGSGRPAFSGDVAVRNGCIAAVGQFSGSGRTEIGAAGRIVVPGFIEVHTHSEKILDLPAAENFVRMGVTTIVNGNCRGSRLDVAEFFRELVEKHVTLNVAILIGHNTLRGQSMGGAFLRPPTTAELEKMCGFVERGMAHGAVGLSTGLVYVPGTYAKSEEIVALAKIAAAHGGTYASHIRYENARIFEAIEEVCVIAREARVRAEISHLKLSEPNAWSRTAQVIAQLERARAKSLGITHDQYSYNHLRPLTEPFLCTGDSNT